MVWFSPLASLSREQLERVSGPRLLLAAATLVGFLGGHRRLVSNWGALHVGGLSEMVMRWGLPLEGCGLLALWIFDAATAASLGRGAENPPHLINTAFLYVS